MTRRQFVVLVVSATVSGFAGGVFSNQMACGIPVAAAAEPGALVSQGDYAVRAESFLLVDARGETRASLGLDPDGASALRMLDAYGQERASIFARAGRAQLVLFGRNGHPSVIMNDVPLLKLATEEGELPPIVLDGHDPRSLYETVRTAIKIPRVDGLPRRDRHRVSNAATEGNKAEVTDADISALWNKIDEIVIALAQLSK